MTNEMPMTEELIKHMVNRFLCWKLPKTFNPDCGIKFQPIINEGTTLEHKYEPTGTNVFCYSEAEQMVRFMLDSAPNLPVNSSVPDWLRTLDYQRDMA